jgi:hypothetical protein
MKVDRFCGLVIRVSGYRSEIWVRFPALPDFLRSLERGPLGLVSTIEQLLEKKCSGFRSRYPRTWTKGYVTLTTWHHLSAKVGSNFADKQWLLGRHSSLANSGHGVHFYLGLNQFTASHRTLGESFEVGH